MSRVAKAPVVIPSDVEVSISERSVDIKGAKGELSHRVHELVTVERKNEQITVAARDESKQSRALSGTTRALLANIVTGVSKGFERKLEIVGVGFRAKMEGKKLNLIRFSDHS